MTLSLLKQWTGRLLCRPRFIRPGDPLVAVLMYHDLCDDGDFANWLRVPMSRFAAQLDTLAELGTFIAPDDLATPDRLPRDRISFLLTFDDGYANWARLAAPLLEQRRIPAQFFVSTAPLTDRRPFWTDVVVTPIQVAALRELDLSAFDLGAFTFRAGPTSARWDDVQRLLVAIKAKGNEDHPEVADLLAWFEREYAEILAEHLPRFRPIDGDEVRRMAGGGFCHFGSHGHEHRVLTRLVDDALHASLTRSRDLLGDLLNRPVTELAYPNGDHDARVRAAAAEAGYTAAYTVAAGLLSGPCPALALPRLSVGAFDSPALLRFHLLRQLMAHRRSRPAAPLAFLPPVEQEIS